MPRRSRVAAFRAIGFVALARASQNLKFGRRDWPVRFDPSPWPCLSSATTSPTSPSSNLLQSGRTESSQFVGSRHTLCRATGVMRSRDGAFALGLAPSLLALSAPGAVSTHRGTVGWRLDGVADRQDGFEIRHDWVAIRRCETLWKPLRHHWRSAFAPHPAHTVLGARAKLVRDGLRWAPGILGCIELGEDQVVCAVR